MRSLEILTVETLNFPTIDLEMLLFDMRYLERQLVHVPFIMLSHSTLTIHPTFVICWYRKLGMLFHFLNLDKHLFQHHQHPKQPYMNPHYNDNLILFHHCCQQVLFLLSAHLLSAIHQQFVCDQVDYLHLLHLY